MGVQRNPTGPLINAQLRQIEDAIFWGPTQPRDIDPWDDDLEYTVKIADRIDLIAAQKLNDPQLGWVIMHRNNLRLMPNDLVPGMKIYIPTRESLRTRGIVK